MFYVYVIDVVIVAGDSVAADGGVDVAILGIKMFGHKVFVLDNDFTLDILAFKFIPVQTHLLSFVVMHDQALY